MPNQLFGALQHRYQEVAATIPTAGSTAKAQLRKKVAAAAKSEDPNLKALKETNGKKTSTLRKLKAFIDKVTGDLATARTRMEEQL